MIRALAGLAALLATGLAAAAPSPSASGLACAGEPTEGDARTRYAALKKDAEAGPFYRHAAKSLGAPEKCEVARDEEALRITYAFPRGGTLVAEIDPAAELSGQRLTVSGLTEAQAVALLKEAEKNAFGDEGCGIAWKKPQSKKGSEAGTTEKAWRGEDCNCQGRAFFRGKAIEQLLFRSAC